MSDAEVTQSCSYLPEVKSGDRVRVNLGGTASCYEILRSRLQAVEANQESYHNHLIRDSNQGEFKDVELDSLDVYSFYALMDYWAKLQSQKSATATCEGNQIGISAHGMMFVHKNPTKAERDIIDNEVGKIDWELFGPASDQGGKAMLEEHINMVSDDAKQNVFHTKSGTTHLVHTHICIHTHTYIPESVTEATINVFLESRPWLHRTGRKSAMQSDNASNYRDQVLYIHTHTHRHMHTHTCSHTATGPAGGRSVDRGPRIQRAWDGQG